MLTTEEFDKNGSFRLYASHPDNTKKKKKKIISNLKQSRLAGQSVLFHLSTYQLLTLAHVLLFAASSVSRRGGGGPSDPSRSAPDGFAEKNERVALSENKPKVPNFKVSSQPMNSEARLNTRSGPSDTTIFRML